MVRTRTPELRLTGRRSTQLPSRTLRMVRNDERFMHDFLRDKVHSCVFKGLTKEGGAESSTFSPSHCSLNWVHILTSPYDLTYA